MDKNVLKLTKKEKNEYGKKSQKWKFRIKLIPAKNIQLFPLIKYLENINFDKNKSQKSIIKKIYSFCQEYYF